MSEAQSSRRLSADDVDVTAIGPVPDGIRESAQERVAHATRLAGRPVRDARVVIRQFTNPARVEATRVEVSLFVGAAPVRARGDGETPAVALDSAVGRVERLIVELVNRWNDRSRWLSVTDAGHWRPGDASAGRPGFVPRSPEEREVVRRKTFVVAPTTVDEAVYDMEALDHDFYLFNDADSARAAVVYRADGGYAVSAVSPDVPLPDGVAKSPAPPTLTEPAARQRLDAGGEPFVFYVDAETGHGAVLYRRYDGHYGLITEA